MILRIFNTGRGNGTSPIRYLLDDKNRQPPPEILWGHAQTTIDAIDCNHRKNKYISGCLALKNGEHLDYPQMYQLIDRFKQTFCAGLTDENFVSFFALHQEKNGEAHIHFLVPSIELKSGKALNIHPPGQRNIQFYKTFVSVINHELGFRQIVADPLSAAFSDFEWKAPAARGERRQKGLAHDYIVKAVRDGKIRNRNDLCHHLENELGITVTRKGSNYISVILPGAKKAKRLTGELYSEQADYAALLDQSLETIKPKFLTPDEFRQAQDRLQAFTDERRAFNVKAYLTPKPMRHRIARAKFQHTTRKEMPMEKPAVTAKSTALLNIREMRNRPESQPISSTQPSNGVIHNRDDGNATQSEATSSDSASSNVKAAMQSASSAQLSLQGAIAQLANAKTPVQKAKAQQAVNEAQARVEKAQAMLAMAKIREVNSQSLTAKRRFK